MSKGPQYHQKTFFKVELWHLLAMAALFLWSIGLATRNYSIPADLNGDLIIITLSGAALTLSARRNGERK
jgi:hypothetical protein